MSFAERLVTLRASTTFLECEIIDLGGGKLSVGKFKGLIVDGMGIHSEMNVRDTENFTIIHSGGVQTHVERDSDGKRWPTRDGLAWNVGYNKMGEINFHPLEMDRFTYCQFAYVGYLPDTDHLIINRYEYNSAVGYKTDELLFRFFVSFGPFFLRKGTDNDIVASPPSQNKPMWLGKRAGKAIVYGAGSNPNFHLIDTTRALSIDPTTVTIQWAITAGETQAVNVSLEAGDEALQPKYNNFERFDRSNPPKAPLGVLKATEWTSIIVMSPDGHNFTFRYTDGKYNSLYDALMRGMYNTKIPYGRTAITCIFLRGDCTSLSDTDKCLIVQADGYGHFTQHAGNFFERGFKEFAETIYPIITRNNELTDLINNDAGRNHVNLRVQDKNPDGTYTPREPEQIIQVSAVWDEDNQEVYLTHGDHDHDDSPIVPVNIPKIATTFKVTKELVNAIKLEWDPINIEGVTYEAVLTQEDGTETTNSHDGQSPYELLFNGMKDGLYDVKIRGVKTGSDPGPWTTKYHTHENDLDPVDGTPSEVDYQTDLVIRWPAVNGASEITSVEIERRFEETPEEWKLVEVANLNALEYTMNSVLIGRHVITGAAITPEGTVNIKPYEVTVLPPKPQGFAFTNPTGTIVDIAATDPPTGWEIEVHIEMPLSIQPVPYGLPEWLTATTYKGASASGWSFTAQPHQKRFRAQARLINIDTGQATEWTPYQEINLP